MTRTRARLFGGRETIPVGLHLLQIGPAVFAGIEGEPFWRSAWRSRRPRPFAATWFGGYTGGWSGYIPTAEEYPRRGYEVETSPYRPEAAAQLAEQTIAALREFAAGR